MIKIAHLTSAHSPNDGRVFYKECCSLDRFGYDVFFVVPWDEGREPKNKHGISLVYYRKYKSKLSRILIGSFAVLKKSLQIKADIYHFHDLDLIPVGILLAFLGKKVVYDIHESYSSQVFHKSWVPKLLMKPLSKIIFLMELFGLKFFKGAVSAAPIVTKTFPEKTKIIECNNYPVIQPITRSEGFISNEESDYIIYSGSISKYRGVCEMINAMTYLDNSDLLLKLLGRLGEGAGLEMMSTLKGWGRTRYLGCVQPNEVMPYMCGAKLGLSLLHPTKQYCEVIPTKIYDYMMAAIPFVASDFPVIKDFVKKYGCGLCVDPYDPREIASAIKYLVENPSESVEMGLKGRHAVEKKLNWGVEAEKLNQLYKSILLTNGVR